MYKAGVGGLGGPAGPDVPDLAVLAVTWDRRFRNVGAQTAPGPRRHVPGPVAPATNLLYDLSNVVVTAFNELYI